MKTAMRTEAVLLDMDGTLADSLPILYKAYQMFLHRYGYEGTREEFDQLNGPSMVEIIGYLKSKYDLPLSAHDLMEQQGGLLEQVYACKVPLFEGARDFLDRAIARGVKLGVVTSAPSRLAEAFLGRHSIRSYFVEVVTSDGLTRGKPDPEIYHCALERMGLMAEQALVVEDSRHGVSAALAANIPTLQICHGPSECAPALGIVPHINGWEEAWVQLESRL